MATLTVPDRFVPRVRQSLLDILSADANELTRCHAVEGAPALEECREAVAKINYLASALDALGWWEGENGFGGDATLEIEPPGLPYIIAELTGGDEQVAAVGDREGQAWIAFLSDLQDQFAAVSA